MNYHSDEIIVVSDLKNKKNTFCSHAVEKILGWKSSDFISGGWAFVASLTHPDDTVEMTKKFLCELALRSTKDRQYDHQPIVFEYRKKHYNGSWRWVKSQVFIFEKDNEHNIIQTVTFIRDITQERLNHHTKANGHHLMNIPDGLAMLWSNDSKIVNDILLSSREKQILQFIRNGFSTKRISDTLGLSVSTINTYRKKMMQKLNAKNSADMVRLSFEYKILE